LNVNNKVLNNKEANNLLHKDFVVGNLVEITHIENPDIAPHLLKFVGKKGEVFSWIIDVDNIKKYKVVFDNDYNNSAYFMGIEMKKND